MLKQKVKFIKNGNVITTNIWSANDIISRGKGYKIGEPFEFPVIEAEPEVVEDIDIDDI